MDELLQRLTRGGVRLLLIGGQAMRLEGMPRFSMDWDFFIDDSPGNLAAINTALGEDADVPVIARGPRGENLLQTYQTRWGVVQFHLAVPGIRSFEEAWTRRQRLVTENGTGVDALCTADLLTAKRASGRPQDELDIEFLEAKLGARH